MIDLPEAVHPEFLKGKTATAYLNETLEKIENGMPLSLLEMDLINLVTKSPQGLEQVEQAQQRAKEGECQTPQLQKFSNS